MTSWKLLAKYIFDQPEPGECEKVEKWIHKSPKNKMLYNDLTQLTKMKKQEEHINVDQAWDKLKSRITEENVSMHETISLIPRQILRYAAILLILFGIGSIGFLSYEKVFNDQQLISEQNSQQTENKKVIFPDGSIAYLNTTTTVNYPNSFNRSGRLINLKGEAFFDIKHNPSQPFIIKAKRAKIEVLGTAFNVRINDKGNIEVFVKSGKVRLSQVKHEQQSIIIQPGYLGIITDNGVKKLKNKNENYLSWYTKKLYFKNTHLPEVAKVIERTYNVDIQFDEKITSDSLALSATFNEENVDYILNVISRTFNIQVQKQKNNKYLLTQ